MIIFPKKMTNERSGQAMALCLAVIAVLTIVIGSAATFYAASGRKARIESADAVSRYLARAAFEKALVYLENKYQTGDLKFESDFLSVQRLSTGYFGVGRVDEFGNSWIDFKGESTDESFSFFGHQVDAPIDDGWENVTRWLDVKSSYYTIYTWGSSDMAEGRAVQMRASVIRTEAGWKIVEWDTEVLLINQLRGGKSYEWQEERTK